jgi:hypothetical protein
MIGVALITTHGSLNANAVSLPALLSGIACAFCVMIYNVEPKENNIIFLPAIMSSSGAGVIVHFFQFFFFRSIGIVSHSFLQSQ